MAIPKKRSWQPWTEDDLATLYGMAHSPGLLKSKTGQMPHRSYSTIKEKVRELGWNRERVSILVLDLLEDNIPRTTIEIAKAIDRTERSVTAFVRDAAAEGDKQLIHVADHDGAHKSRRFVFGAGRNAGPIKVIAGRRLKICAETVIDEKFRRAPTVSVTPVPDELYMAMAPMAQAGRASA